MDEKSSIILMVQSAYKVFCYYNISPLTVKNFEDIYGENAWENSKPVLKMYEVDEGIAKEIETIYLDAFANNWYINLNKDDMDVFVKLGRMLPDDKFVAISVSNTITTPRDRQSGDRDVYYVDLSQEYKEKPDTVLPTYNENDECKMKRNEPKPYPFMVKKKNIKCMNQ
nr:DUF4912 domain-containing protein [Clostridium ganghwense]